MDISIGNLYFALKVTENGKQVMSKSSKLIAKMTNFYFANISLIYFGNNIHFLSFTQVNDSLNANSFSNQSINF